MVIGSEDLWSHWLLLPILMTSVSPGSAICTVVALCVLFMELDALEDVAGMQNQVSFLCQRVYSQSILKSVTICKAREGTKKKDGLYTVQWSV